MREHTIYRFFVWVFIIAATGIFPFSLIFASRLLFLFVGIAIVMAVVSYILMVNAKNDNP